MHIDITKRLSQEELRSPASTYTNPFDYTFFHDQRVEEVLNTIRSKKSEQRVDLFVILDQDSSLQGVVSLQDLIYTSPNTLLSELVDREIVTVGHEDSLEKALKLFTKHQMLIIPVVDDKKRFLGVIELIPPGHEIYKANKQTQAALRQDIFQLIGFSIEETKWDSSWSEYRSRMPWLFCNLIGGLICAVIGQVFQSVLIQFVILALFIPLVLTLSESVAIQSMTLSLRFLHLREIRWMEVWKRIFTEWKTSALLGLSSAMIVGLFYIAWSLEIKPILAIGMSTILSMTASATFGALFPILLHVLHLDPKVAAGPVVLMLADIVTVVFYFGLSTVLLL